MLLFYFLKLGLEACLVFVCIFGSKICTMQCGQTYMWIANFAFIFLFKAKYFGSQHKTQKEWKEEEEKALQNIIRNSKKMT